jgi:hypothetical protein
MIYVILGMHKSGTTLIARTLQVSGVRMVEKDTGKSYDEGYQFEHEGFKDINKRLLADNGRYSLDIKEDIVGDTEETRSIMCALIKRHQGAYPDWGFKDPRTSLTYVIWRELLPAHKVIVMYRHPHEVYAHYTREHNPAKWLYVCWQVLGAWYSYNRRIVDQLKEHNGDVLYINYKDLMNDDDLYRTLERFIGRKLTDVREKGLYRGKRSVSVNYTLLAFVRKWLFGKDVEGLFQVMQEMSARP